MNKKDLRKGFNEELYSKADESFTEYEKYLENKIIKMDKENFKRFMRLQKSEIEKYKWCESEKVGHDLGNECCQDWIKKFAIDFANLYWGKENK